MAACGLPFFGGVDLSGPCTLHAQVEDATRVLDLTPPYVVTAGADTVVSFSGSGWRDARLVVTLPGGDIRERPFLTSEVDDADRHLGGFLVDQPGMWRFAFTDNQAGCAAEFSVDVRG